MAVNQPSGRGPRGRSRSRLSASAVTTWLRCPRQWYLTRRLGIRGPISPEQILGRVLEEAFCGLLMERPNASDRPGWARWPKHHGLDQDPPESVPLQVASKADLDAWIRAKVPATAAAIQAIGAREWDRSAWTVTDRSWSDLTHERIVASLHHGLDLQMEEVERCHASGGGPHLGMLRAGGPLHDVPAPCWDDAVAHPYPKDRTTHLLESEPVTPPICSDGPVSWREAWELARPWVKDPRVDQPQRIHHPNGHASGECDLILRWDGSVRIVDIKSGTGQGAFSRSLAPQIRYYRWLWVGSFGENPSVSGIEGWYLGSGHREVVPMADGFDDASLLDILNAMNTIPLEASVFPASVASTAQGVAPCEGDEAGCRWCAAKEDMATLPMLPEPWSSIPLDHIRSLLAPSPPMQPIASIPERVNVRGSLQSPWGPMANHHSEPVLGGVLVAGQRSVTVEEAETGARSDLHEFTLGREVILVGALPGVWRRQPRLYIDRNTRILSPDEDDTPLTRLGLLPTRASVRGMVLSCHSSSGVRVDGRPWTLHARHLWDGHRIIEVVAFGGAASRGWMDLRPGMIVDVQGAELGWRAGSPQLRLDARTTRFSASLAEDVLTKA